MISGSEGLVSTVQNSRWNSARCPGSPCVSCTMRSGVPFGRSTPRGTQALSTSFAIRDKAAGQHSG